MVGRSHQSQPMLRLTRVLQWIGSRAGSSNPTSIPSRIEKSPIRNRKLESAPTSEQIRVRDDSANKQSGRRCRVNDLFSIGFDEPAVSTLPADTVTTLSAEEMEARMRDTWRWLEGTPRPAKSLRDPESKSCFSDLSHLAETMHCWGIGL